MSMHEILQDAYTSLRIGEFRDAVDSTEIDVNELDDEGRSVAFVLMQDLCEAATEKHDRGKDRLRIICFYILTKSTRLNYDLVYRVRVDNRKTSAFTLTSYAVHRGSILLTNLLNGRACECACCARSSEMLKTVSTFTVNTEDESEAVVGNAVDMSNVAAFELAMRAQPKTQDNTSDNDYRQSTIHDHLGEILTDRWCTRNADRVVIICFYIVLRSIRDDLIKCGRDGKWTTAEFTNLIFGGHKQPDILLLSLTMDMTYLDCDFNAKHDFDFRYRRVREVDMTLFEYALALIRERDGDHDDKYLIGTVKVINWLTEHPEIDLDMFEANSDSWYIWQVAISMQFEALVTHLLESDAYRHGIWKIISSNIVTWILVYMRECEHQLDTDQIALAKEIFESRSIDLSGSGFTLTLNDNYVEENVARGIRILFKQERLDVHRMYVCGVDEDEDDDDAEWLRFWDD